MRPRPRYRRGCARGLIAPFRLNWLRAVRSQSGAEYLAGGLALGVFLACYPLFVLHFPLAWGLARLLRVSRLAAIVGAYSANPVTVAPLYAATYALGTLLVPADGFSPLRDPSQLAREGWGVLAQVDLRDLSTLLVGCTMLALPATGLVRYFAARWLRARRDRRRNTS